LLRQLMVRVVLVPFVSVAVGLCLTARVAAQDAAASAETNVADELIPFVLNIQGLEKTPLDSRFRSLSLLYAAQKKKTDSRGRLARLLTEDTETLERLLRAEGYFGARFDAAVTPAPGPAGSVVVYLKVTPGPRFTFDQIATPGMPGLIGPINMRAAGVTAGAPAVTQAILDAEARLRVALPRAGFPFFEMKSADVEVDHATAKVNITLPVETGPQAKFGQLRFAGEEVAKPGHLGNIARFAEGQSYDARRVDDLRERLLATGLYANLNVRTVASADNPAVADILVEGTAAKPRTVSVSGGYGTSEGPKIEASWQHRNLFGGEERVTFLGRAGTIEQTLRADLQKSNFRKRDQNLVGRAVLSREDTDAYNSLNTELGIGIERVSERLFQKRITYSVGTEFLVSNERPKGGVRDTYYVASLPGTIRYDGTDDLFDPTKGFRVAAALIPELSVRRGVSTYAVTEMSGSVYQSFGQKIPVTLAARARTGSIIGAALDKIASVRRFYAGGGGSVRGFNYQGVGPSFTRANGDIVPTGGRSLSEVSLEARIRVTDTIGIVPFVDGGNVYTGRVPKISGFRWGAGVGLRYYTAFAPVRVDIARALDKRAGDPAFAIYVSIGQSF
jgi:translocation and assembly module TamA